MITIILGILFIAFTVFACLPMGPLAWGDDVISFLKGCAPVLSAFLGFICFFIGAAENTPPRVFEPATRKNGLMKHEGCRISTAIKPQ